MKKLALVAAAALAGCTGTTTLPTPAADTAQPATLTTTSPALAAAATNAGNATLASLPIDDYRYTTAGPKKTYVYSCQSTFNGPGAGSQSLPWVNAGGTTWNYNSKAKVEGNVTWTSSFTSAVRGAQRALSGNGLPKHATGIFPISESDPAHAYDMNPSSIEAQTLAYRIPSQPKIATAPSCLNMGTIGVMNTGAQLFNAFDAQGRDAAVHEVLDKCWGHPQQEGAYHYHSFSTCMADSASGHSALLGYALDGFAIYGPRGQDGSVLASNQLDECHGHTHAIVWNGKRVTMYHYHFTYDFPYSLGCYRGTPAA